MHAGFQQTIDEAAIFFIREILRNRRRNNFANVFDIHQFLLGCAHQRFQRAKMRHQIISRFFANIRNTDGKQKRVQFAILALFQLGKELVRFFLAESFERNQLFTVKAVQIRR